MKPHKCWKFQIWTENDIEAITFFDDTDGWIFIPYGTTTLDAAVVGPIWYAKTHFVKSIKFAQNLVSLTLKSNEIMEFLTFLPKLWLIATTKFARIGFHGLENLKLRKLKDFRLNLTKDWFPSRIPKIKISFSWNIWCCFC